VTTASLPNSSPTSVLLTWWQPCWSSLLPLKTSGLLLLQGICFSWMAQPLDLCMVFYLAFKAQGSPPQRCIYCSAHLKWPTPPVHTLLFHLILFFHCLISQSGIFSYFFFMCLLSKSLLWNVSSIGQDFCLPCVLLYPEVLEQSLLYRWWLVNICWIREWITNPAVVKKWGGENWWKWGIHWQLYLVTWDGAWWRIMWEKECIYVCVIGSLCCTVENWQTVNQL